MGLQASAPARFMWNFDHCPKQGGLKISERQRTRSGATFSSADEVPACACGEAGCSAWPRRRRASLACRSCRSRSAALGRHLLALTSFSGSPKWPLGRCSLAVLQYAARLQGGGNGREAPALGALRTQAHSSSSKPKARSSSASVRGLRRRRAFSFSASTPNSSCTQHRSQHPNVRHPAIDTP